MYKLIFVLSIPLFLIYLLICLLSPLLRFGKIKKGADIDLYISKDLIHSDYLFDSSLWADLFGSDKRYVKIGWGDRKIFLETRTWSELKLKDVLFAFWGLNETVLRVEFVEEMPPSTKKITISAEQFAVIKKHVIDSYENKKIERKETDYQGGEFYESKLGYNCITNCNNWVNRGLFLAGVTNKIWCPLSLWI